MSLRDTLRSAAFNNKPRKRIPIQYSGVDFELLGPTVAERKEILRRSKRTDGMQPVILDMQTWVAIFCTVVPGTFDKVFSIEDAPTFEAMSMDSFLDEVGKHQFGLMNLTTEAEKKTVADPSEETPS